MNPVASSILIGAGATALVDLWSLARRRLMHTPLPDYGLVGRWIAWLPRGRFRHRPIAATPALLFGLATVAAPFLLMQPGMGAGIAASRSPRPGVARVQSLLTHAVFGVGLYAVALLLGAMRAA